LQEFRARIAINNRINLCLVISIFKIFSLFDFTSSNNQENQYDDTRTYEDSIST